MKLRVNGLDHVVEAPRATLLVDLLREELRLTGTKRGCDDGSCGACTVLIDGEPRPSCLTFAALVEGREVTTIEGIGSPQRLHPVQEAMVKNGALQCGFCTPGVVLTGVALLSRGKPTREEIKEAISGHFCRCTGYVKIVEAIESVSGEERP